MKSVINTRVKRGSIFDCSLALFEIIASGEFEEVTTEKRTKAAFENFEELTDEGPRFIVKKISTNPPRSKVTLLNSYGLKGIEAEARNVLTAKVLTLEKYINLMG